MRSANETAFPRSGELVTGPTEHPSGWHDFFDFLTEGAATLRFTRLDPRTGEPLIEDAQEKYRITQDVAAPQPSRLAQQAIDPFHAYRTHPDRRARNVSRQEVN